MCRFLISPKELYKAVACLDARIIPYQIDGGDILMVDEAHVETAVKAWDRCGVAYEEF